MVPVRQAEGAGNADDGVESSVSHCASSARTCRCKGKSLAAGMLRHSALDDIRASIGRAHLDQGFLRQYPAAQDGLVIFLDLHVVMLIIALTLCKLILRMHPPS